jgi:hypothetical protein
MKASIAVASAILAAATVMLASGPAQATHKASCGKRWAEAGYFYVDKNCPFLTSSAHNKAAQSARGQCKNELKERGEDTYGASFSGLEKFSSNCVPRPAWDRPARAEPAAGRPQHPESAQAVRDHGPASASVSIRLHTLKARSTHAAATAA